MVVVWRELSMKYDYLAERAQYLSHTKELAKAHYGDVENEDEAVLQFLARSVAHSKEDDARLTDEVELLKDRITKIEDIINAR
jgi:hypothetical protein